MLLQTNSYIVPKERRAEHARLLRRFRLALAKLGCDSFEVYEQVGANWSSGEPTGRYVQIMRFRDRRHQLSVQAAERTDPASQAIIAEFCQLINFPYQQQQGLFAVGFYNAVIPAVSPRAHGDAVAASAAAAAAPVEAEPESAAAETVEPADIPAGEHEDYAPAPEAVADAELESPVAGETLAEADGVTDEEAGRDDAADRATAEADDELQLAGDADTNAENEPIGAEGELTVEEGELVEADSNVNDAEDDLGPAAEGANGEDSNPPFADGNSSGEIADDELGALLDAHLDEAAAPEGGAHPGRSIGDTAGDPDIDKFEALDALDIDDLDLPDSPLAEPGQQQNHARR